MDKKYLSAIITFANEKEEVEKTIKSLRKHSFSNLPIILINDASDDGYDYDFLENKYKLIYIKNKERLGTGKSRDLGVKACETPFFILLDAHMRFYDKVWQPALVDILLKEEKVLLCCQTRNIRQTKKEKANRPTGAKIIFFGENNTFETCWNYEEKQPGATLEEIPCVLGATYATSKKYWTYLKGLTGLKSYGGDEAYISIKVWLEGGKCKLLKNITIGHLYRKAFPYRFDNSHMLYNKMLIAELLFPRRVKGRILSRLKWDYRAYPRFFDECCRTLEKNKASNQTLRAYYHAIFHNPFEYFRQFNDSFSSPRAVLPYPDNPATDIDQVAIQLILNLDKSNIGLYHGLMGNVLFFQQYASYKNDTFYETLAEELLTIVLNSADQETSMGFENGLSGIGWGIEYLLQHRLMAGDADEILAEIDQRMMTINFRKLTDDSLSTGIAGYLHYIYSRMNRERTPGRCPFDGSFLQMVKETAFMLICKPDAFEGVDIALRLLDSLEDPHPTYELPDTDDFLQLEEYRMTANNGLSIAGQIGKCIHKMIRNEKK